MPAIQKISQPTGLMSMERARAEIANAKTADDAKAIADKAKAACIYCKEANLGEDLVNDCFEVKIRAEYRAGQILRSTPKNAGAIKSRGSQREPRDVVALKELGISKKQSMRWQRFASVVQPSRLDKLLATARERGILAKFITWILREHKESHRQARRDENTAKVEAADTPEEAVEAGAKFATIVIDPPWDWGDEGDQDQLGRARPTYSTMSIEELEALTVGEFADVDCHLYLWITNRSLPKGFRLLDAWGFRYVTCLTWVKPHFGMGNYFRGQTEHVLFGVKGSQPLKRKDVGTVFHAARGPNGHSSKPPEFYELVESCSPGPYLEMFSRMDRQGWVHWGENS